MEEESSFDKLIADYKIPIIVGLLGAVLLVSGIISSGIIPKTFRAQPKSDNSPVQPSQQPGTLGVSQVVVDVSGSVIKPGVYHLSPGARVEDAIGAAGGISDQADQDYVVKSLNLAQKVTDGMKIFIPNQGDNQSVAGASAYQGQSGNSAITNINSASLDSLDTLPGIGPVTAQKIVDNRPYASIEELLSKKAVSKSVFEKIKEKVSAY